MAETKAEIKEEKEEKKEVVKAIFAKERILTENSDAARELYNQNRFGTLLEDGKVQLSLLEALYLIEKNRIKVFDGKDKKISSDDFIKKAQKIEPNFWIRYCVFK